MNSYRLLVAIWAFVVASEFVLMFVLLWRRAWRENAAFTGFAVFCVLRSCLLLYAGLVLKSSRAYFLIWWGAYPPQTVLLIAIVFEVIQIIFRPFDALPRGMLGNFALASFTVIVLTVAFTLQFPGRQSTEWITFLRAMDQGVSWTLLGIFAMIVGFSKLLGIPWNHRVYGIVVGFLFYLSVDAAVVTIAAQVGFPMRDYIWPADMLAFLVTCSEWTYYFARAEVPRAVPKMEEVNRIAAILSQYIFVIEALEVKKSPRTTTLEDPVHLHLRTEEQ